MTRNVVAERTTATADALPSWRDAPARQAILEFVARVTGADGSAPVPDDERVAVFDNDGPMLDVAQHADRPFLRLLLAHDDADRESPTPPEPRRCSTRPTATWTVVSKKDDWTCVF